MTELPPSVSLDPPARHCPRCSWKLIIAAVLFWLLAIGIAFKFDARIANSVERLTPNARTGQMESIGILSKYSLPARLIRVPGNFLFTMAVAALLYVFHPWKWRAAGLLVAAAVIGGVIYQFGKWAIGRERPQYHLPYTFFHFTDGLRGFVTADKLSMPSGHSMLVFATATVLTICIPRWWVLFFIFAAIVGAERVLEHSHYLSDVIAGAGVGVFSALLAKWIMNLLAWPALDSVAGSPLQHNSVPPV